MGPKYFVVYLTANDSLFFYHDYFNLRNMCRHDPGVEHVHLYIAVSEVQKINSIQRRLFTAILDETNTCKWLTCEKVILKSNTGRDFSSMYHCLMAMKANVADEDFILVRNRSSRGPFARNWYKKYIDLMSTDTRIGMVGSTINLNDHYSRGLKQNASHVQTYAFLSQWKYLVPLLNDFPGLKAVSHIDAIIQGEIELSQRIMGSGALIISLQKPEMILDVDCQNDHDKLKHTPRLEFRELPIIHRKRQMRNVCYWINQLSYVKIIRPLFGKKKPVVFI